MKYKKFILLQWDTYYPSGGLGNVKESFDTLEQAQEYVKKHRYDYSEVVDRDTWEEVWSE